MKKLSSLMLAATILIGANAFAGPKLTKGNLGFLKGQAKVAVEFDYSKLGVGKYKSEEDYINKKVAEYNKDEPGRGDKWKESWFNDRPTRFEPKFLELFNESSPNTKAEKGADRDYVMVVKTTFVEPGYNIGVSKMPAYVNFTIVFYKKDDRNNSLAEILMTKVPGSQFAGFDFDTGTRISESYAKGGKDLGKFLAKSVK